MEFIEQYHLIAATLLARVFLGILFLFQGYDAIFNIGLKNVSETFQTSFANKKIPNQLINLAVYFTSFTELIGGVFLITGFCEYFALYALGVNLLIAALGFSINSAMWDMRFVFPRLLLLLLLLFTPQSWHTCSLDNLFF